MSGIFLVGKRQDGGLFNGRMPIQRSLDLTEFHPVPALLDHTVASPEEFVVKIASVELLDLVFINIKANNGRTGARTAAPMVAQRRQDQPRKRVSST